MDVTISSDELITIVQLIFLEENSELLNGLNLNKRSQSGSSFNSIYIFVKFSFSLNELSTG